MVEKESTTTPNMFSEHHEMLLPIIIVAKKVSFANIQKVGKP
jgi:hypothetical protein